jgi:hypothetical protein
MLAYWVGGACAGTEVAPPQQGVSGGGGVRKRRPEDWLKRVSRDDEEIIMLIPELWTVIHHED